MNRFTFKSPRTGVEYGILESQNATMITVYVIQSDGEIQNLIMSQDINKVVEIFSMFESFISKQIHAA